MKIYIVFYNGRIGYVKDVCKCEKCMTRKQFEWFINDLDDGYLDCIQSEDEIKEILYIGHSLKDAVDSLNKYYKNKINRKETELKFSESVNKFYRDLI